MPHPRVIVVFDPNLYGMDFAYTTFLHVAGLPELHLWARPDMGNEHTHDFALSPADRQQVLEQLASMCLAGEIGPGSTGKLPLDGGESWLEWRLSKPQPPAAVEAFNVASAATVITVSWALGQSAIAPPDLGTPADRAAARSLATLLAKESTGVDIQPPDIPNGQFGPQTPVIEVVCVTLRNADAFTWLDLALDAVRLPESNYPALVLGKLLATARRTGRHLAVAAALAAAEAATTVGINTVRANLELLWDAEDISPVTQSVQLMVASAVAGLVLADQCPPSGPCCALISALFPHYAHSQCGSRASSLIAEAATLDAAGAGRVLTELWSFGPDNLDMLAGTARGELLASGLLIPNHPSGLVTSELDSATWFKLDAALAAAYITCVGHNLDPQIISTLARPWASA